MKYFIIAGEASGDLHASRLITSLRQRDPEARFVFLGGDRMAQAAATEPLVHCRDMAFMGFVNVIRNLDKINLVSQKARRAFTDFRPDRLILVDYPGFNLRFAHWVKSQKTDVETDYYISPKLWAWKSWRIRDIKRYVDRMFTIFPFETEYFARRNYHVQYVGNPTVDSVAAFRRHSFDAEAFRRETGLDSRPVVALLAGSRRQEINKCLPVMLRAVRGMEDCQFVVAAAPDADPELYTKVLADYPQVKIVSGRTYELLSTARAAVVNSGTATLETALFRVPEVVVYKVAGGRVAAWVLRVLIKTEHVSLVNIIARRAVVVELLAHHFTADATRRELDRLLTDEAYRQEIIKGYDEVIAELGPDGAPDRLAELLTAR